MLLQEATVVDICKELEARCKSKVLRAVGLVVHQADKVGTEELTASFGDVAMVSFLLQKLNQAVIYDALAEDNESLVQGEPE